MYELFPYSMVKLLPEYDGKKFKFVHFNLSKDFVDMEKIIHNTKGRLDEVEGLKSGKYIKLVDKNSDEIVMSDT